MSYQNIKIPLNIFRKDEIYQFLDRFQSLPYERRTFHFFYEEGYLEIRIDSNVMELYTDFIKKYINYLIEKNKIIGDVEKVVKFEDYIPEIDNYGDGWIIAEKLFEFCANAAIHIRMGRSNDLFREQKFIHCFLNQLGYDSLAEASFHTFAAQQMLIKHMREIEIPIYPILQNADNQKQTKVDKEQGPEFA